MGDRIEPKWVIGMGRNMHHYITIKKMMFFYDILGFIKQISL